MNTTHKWSSYNDYNYQYYPQNLKAEKDENSPQETVAKAEEISTNFLNLPKGFKIGG